jgi:hypothetical protein
MTWLCFPIRLPVRSLKRPRHMLPTGMWRGKLVRISVVVVGFPDRIHVREEEWMNSENLARDRGPFHPLVHTEGIFLVGIWLRRCGVRS